MLVPYHGCYKCYQEVPALCSYEISGVIIHAYLIYAFHEAYHAYLVDNLSYHTLTLSCWGGGGGGALPL